LDWIRIGIGIAFEIGNSNVDNGDWNTVGGVVAW
jgi:hypothetical protein